MDKTDAVGGKVLAGVHEVLGPVSVGDVFSEPQTLGDRLVISAAAVEKAGGFGFGAGGDSEDNGGGGGGGGGSVAGRPVAVIDVGPHGVEIHPVIDMTKIGIAVIATVVALIRMGRKR